MTRNPLALAHTSALTMNDEIGRLFSSIGTQAAPRGFVISAYRNARRAMKTALNENDPVTAAQEVFQHLRAHIRSESLSIFHDAQARGADEAARQLRFYGIQSNPHAGLAERNLATAMLDAVLARIDAQSLNTRALLLTGADPEQIIGSDSRQGTLQQSDIAALIASLVATLLWNSFSSWTYSASGGMTFNKQVVAALDERTTDCCLRAHGQIQPLDKPFKLTGFPRFADEMDWSPFHWYCRTSIALYLPGYDDGLTAAMEEAARQILKERENGGSGYRNPANGLG
jgi:hypothetical protein